MRTREGMKVAKAKGRLRGKQPKLNATQEAHLFALYRAGEHTVSEFEELFPVTRSTIYRAVARAGGRTTLASAVDAATFHGPARLHQDCMHAGAVWSVHSRVLHIRNCSEPSYEDAASTWILAIDGRSGRHRDQAS